MTATDFLAAYPSRQPRVRPTLGHTHRIAQRAALAGLLALALTLVACDTPAPKPTSRATPGGISPTLITGGGAVRASDGSILWSQNLGLAPALSANGVLYTLTVTSPRPYLVVRAVRASDGAILWSSQPTGCCGPIALAGDFVLVPTFQQTNTEPGVGISGQLSLVALHADNGHVAWQSDTVSALLIPQLDTAAPSVSALAISNNRIVAVAAAPTPGTGYAVAWNLTDGKLAWRVPLDGRADYSTPSLSINAGGAVVTVEYGGNSEIAAFDLATGKSLWHRALGMSALDLTTNAVDVFSDRATGVITGVRPWDGTTLWQANFGPMSGGRYLQYDVAADADTIYYRHFTAECTSVAMQSACAPQLSAVSLSSGAVRWQRTLDPIDPDFAINLVPSNGVLYYQYFIAAQSGGNQFFLLALDARDGHPLWQHTTMTDSLFVFLLATDEAVFTIATNTKSACPLVLESLNTRDGSLRWARPFPTCSKPYLRAGAWLLLD